MSTSSQLPLRFPEAPLGFDGLCITPANAQIIAAIKRTGAWSAPVFCLTGTAGAGLTTLAIAWAADCGGLFVDLSGDGADLPRPSEIGGEFVALDRADLCRQEDWLLTLFSASQRLGGRVLMTARTPPSDWGLQSGDLVSRLRSAPIASLGLPDEPLMRARLHRAAARSALSLPPAVEAYLIIRLGLSYEAIEETVTRLAGAAGGRRALTVPMARAVLDAGQDQGVTE